MTDADKDPPKRRYRTKTTTLARARRLRRDMTEPEKRLWNRLCDNQLGGRHFRRQVPLGDYIADFCCLRPKPVVELDGETHVEISAAEARRARWLRGEGYQVLRFWNNEVMENIEGVLAQIARALGSRWSKGEGFPGGSDRAGRGCLLQKFRHVMNRALHL